MESKVMEEGAMRRVRRGEREEKKGGMEERKKRSTKKKKKKEEGERWKDKKRGSREWNRGKREVT